MLFGKTFASALEAPPVLDRRQALAGVPEFNSHVKCSENGGTGTLTLVVTMKRRADFLGKFQPKSWERNIELDELGSFVAGLIDGKRTALEIVEAFVTRFKINRREAELCTMQFLKSLIERNVISVAVPLPPEVAGSKSSKKGASK